MKNFIILINVVIVLWITSIFSVETTHENAKVTKQLAARTSQMAPGIEGEKTNAKPDLTKIKVSTVLDRAVFDFILDAAEARMNAMEQGKIAQQRATSRALKDYAALMVNNHSQMLQELKKIASRKKININISFAERKSGGFEELKEAHGKDFDDKFVRMMTLDHKRDLKEFEKALGSTDPDIQVFATKYLPVVKSHLDKIVSIKNAN